METGRSSQLSVSNVRFAPGKPVSLSLTVVQLCNEPLYNAKTTAHFI